VRGKFSPFLRKGTGKFSPTKHAQHAPLHVKHEFFHAVSMRAHHPRYLVAKFEAGLARNVSADSNSRGEGTTNPLKLPPSLLLLGDDNRHVPCPMFHTCCRTNEGSFRHACWKAPSIGHVTHEFRGHPTSITLGSSTRVLGPPHKHHSWEFHTSSGATPQASLLGVPHEFRGHPTSITLGSVPRSPPKKILSDPQ